MAKKLPYPPGSHCCHAMVDRLIDWYEKFRPEGGRQIKVFVKEGTVRKFAKKDKSSGGFVYRSRTIVPADQWMVDQ